MACVSSLLYYEYNFFKKQSHKMIELQEDYRTYIGAVNKILRDYNKIKEKIEELNYSRDNKIKKKRC